MKTTDTTTTDGPSENNPRTPNAPHCEVTVSCGTNATTTVDHPQRGDLRACPLHAKRVRAIPKSRFERIEVAR
jgi:hypothetical protein